MEFFGLSVLMAASVAIALILFRREQNRSVAGLQSTSQALQGLLADVRRLTHTQEELRHDVQRTREASLLQLAEAAQGIRGDIGQAQRALAEVKALEQGRARHIEQAADSLKRLEAVMMGSSTRGSAGENILARALSQLPPDLLEVNVSFGSRIVEFALRLPGGRYLPIDSKWTSLAVLERLEVVEAAPERRKLVEQVLRDLRGKIREMSKYLDPERTLGLGLLAVPDAVHEAGLEAAGEGYRLGIVVVPYSLALPYILALYRLTLRFGAAVDTDQLTHRLRFLEEILRGAADEVESRLSRSLVQLQNARDALRDHLADAHRTAERLLRHAESEAPGPALELTPQPAYDVD
jgi:DNA recombination protein RmuC